MTLKAWRFSFLGCWNYASETTSIFQGAYVSKINSQEADWEQWWIKESSFQEAVTEFIFFNSQDRLGNAIKRYWSEPGPLMKQHCIISYRGSKSPQWVKAFSTWNPRQLKRIIDFFPSTYKWDSHIKSESGRHNIMTFLLGFFLLT